MEGRTIVFVDESGFYLLPGLVRTYAPCGQTPVLRSVYTRDHVSVMSGITMDGRLYSLIRDNALDSLDSMLFLKHLLPHVSEKLLVIWDGSPIHKGHGLRQRFVHNSHTAHPTDIMGRGVFTKPLAPSPV